MRREDNFIIIYNDLITEGVEKHLTIEELYLYGLLRKKETLEGFAETSVSFLGQTSPIQFASETQRTNKKVKGLLLILKSKGCINISDADGTVLEDFKPSDFIKVTFPFQEGGFAQIPVVNFNNYKSMSDFYIYCCVVRWKNSGKGYFNSSYSRWGKILQITERHAIDLVNKAVENKIIYKNIGDYVDSENGGQKQQKLNQYSTTPFNNNEKSVQTKKQESDIANEEFHSNRVNSDNELIQMVTVGRVFKTYKDDKKRNVYPSVDDYVFYLLLLKKLEGQQPTKSEQNFIDTANKRIERMKNNRKFVSTFEQAKRMVDRQINSSKENSFLDELTMNGKSIEDVF